MMRSPIIALRDRRGQGENPGLLLQRYLSAAATGDDGDADERRKLLQAARSAAASPSLQEMYADAYRRWNESFKDGVHAEDTLRTSGRLIVSLGAQNVLEAGLRLNHTYGVPVIPGSALKGLASHYCHDVWGDRENQAPQEANRLFRRNDLHHNLLFGEMDDGGSIVFHDAWITPASLDGSNGRRALNLDVMTPHHPKWQNREAPPTDFDSPIPVTYLSVDGDFQLRVSWAGPKETPESIARDWTRLALDLLKSAVGEWGIGGKTSSGYGRLLPIDAGADRPAPATSAAVRPASIKSWQTVEATIVPDSKNKGRLFAKHLAAGLEGPILHPDDVPAEQREVGVKLSLIVASISVDGKQIQFLYPTPANQERARKSHQPASRPKPSDKRGRR